MAKAGKKHGNAGKNMVTLTFDLRTWSSLY